MYFYHFSVLYYENSLSLATFSLLLTMILSKLEKSNTKAPEFLTSITSDILKSKMGKVLFINMLDPKAYVGLKEVEDDTILIATKKKEHPWKYVTILIGWISFIVVLIIYIVTLIIYLPHDSTKVNENLFEMRLRKFSKSDDIISD